LAWSLLGRQADGPPGEHRGGKDPDGGRLRDARAIAPDNA
jgi:hypothetical protein